MHSILLLLALMQGITRTLGSGLSWLWSCLSIRQEEQDSKRARLHSLIHPLGQQLTQLVIQGGLTLLELRSYMDLSRSMFLPDGFTEFSHSSRVGAQMPLMNGGSGGYE